MLSFLVDAFAAGVGFILAKLGTVWFDSRVSHSSFIEEERTQDVHRIVAQIDRVSELGGLYWLRDGSDEDEELKVQIVPAMHDIGKMCSDMFDGDAGKAVETEVNRLDSVLTGGEFGGRERKKDEIRAIQMRSQAHDLARVVRNQRRKLKRKWF
ncbi:hypothetical protein ALP8811_03112 [Aliiroseovarius pelagivivens]|uniref:Uncharacterized protein n=1 Tax=Aliiroseovarius pelagivivens TaxID=1639690 RepID=A0A2R8ATI7_9RHOB|nr:hypothetical protein [Aliiroseovarius pelagivivens]SPF79174.1 hypothetical protein ALP8811_03112 [Aliiroseovarius pelagivivens]